jgi:hypothetical protein
MNPLLKSQKNEIFKALVSSGIDESVIGQIEWLSNASRYRAYKDADDDGSGVALRLNQDSVTFFFYFNGSSNRWAYRGFPIGVGNGEEIGYGKQWNELLNRLKYWGQKISAELNTPDLWTDILNIKSGYSVDYEEFKDNKPITAKEAHAIKYKLKMLENKILESYGNTEEHIKIITEKFEYLNEGIERQGKKDWLYTLTGVLASLAIAVGVSAANSDEFWQLVKTVLGSSIKLLLGN